MTTLDSEQWQVDELIAKLPAHAWRRMSAGAGAHGPRDYDRARIPIRTDCGQGRYWLLARRKISDPTKIANTSATGPAVRVCII